MLKLKIVTFVFLMTALLSSCANNKDFPTASNESQAPDAVNFYPEDSSTSHNFGPGY